MDFNLKQWREQHQHQQQYESENEQTQTPPARLPRLLFHSNPPYSEVLPLFVTEPTSKLSSNTLSAYPNPADSSNSATKWMGGSYFSLAQWQELELQALIFRHMLSGAAVPPELLHLVKKSLVTNSSHPYYFPNPPLPHYPHFQQAASLQSGYWGRASMDSEPGRCRRTDGKKWRCARDVVAGHRYCERHMHRGRNRSRKPVEIPTAHNGGSAAGRMLKASNNNSNFAAPAQQLFGGALAAAGGRSGIASQNFAFSGPSPSVDLLQLSQRSSEPIIESQNAAPGDDKSSGQGQIIRHFFDDWPRRPPFEEHDEGAAGSSTRSVGSTATNFSISNSGAHPTSDDFSLKLSTGDGDGYSGYSGGGQAGCMEQERTPSSSWAAPLGAVHVSSMGGPLAEALRSSTSNTSPTSVLHQLRRGSASEASYGST